MVPRGMVVRRVTNNLVDDSEVENLLVADAPEKFNWHAPLPEGVTDIETVLYYRAPASEAQASEAQASGSEVGAKASPEAAPEPKTVAPPATPPSEEEEAPPPPPPLEEANGGEVVVGESVVDKPADWVTQEELMRQAKTAYHLFCHDEFNPYCRHCRRAHAQRKNRRKGTLDLGPKPTKFGEQTTGDHLVSRARVGSPRRRSAFLER